MRKLAALICSLCFVPASFACTTFFINRDGEMFFGRNYDWVTGNGMICTNNRGLLKTSAESTDGGTISWVSRWGSISFNQYGKEFPTGGMNEKGLVVELMWLDDTRYPNADNRPAIGVLQWIQYQLDNCASIEEVIGTDKKLRIASKGTTPLHYLVADANGHAAAIEFLDGKMLVHAGADLPFPVLTNTRYDQALMMKEKNLLIDNSIDRFAKACSMINTLPAAKSPTSLVDYSFSILSDVSQANTQWSIVYDISNRKILFKTRTRPAIKNLSFSVFGFDCPALSKAWNLDQDAAGNISKLFADFSVGINEQVVEKSFAESTSQFTETPDGRKKTWLYAGSIFCK